MPVPPSPSLQPSKLLLLLAALVAAAAGCKPKIGDECQISTDCSASADRLCDITAPAGYCTVFNCEPGTCPDDESLCVQFGAQRSPVAACQDSHAPSPYARTFCMALCEGDDDCRDGYQCANLRAEDNQWGALLIDRDRGNKACVVKPTAAEVVQSDDPGFGDVCHAELPSESEPDASGGAGGMPGAVGAGGAPSADAGAGGAPSPAAAGQSGAEAGGAGG